MTTKDLIKGILETWRFPVVQEGENSLVIRYQMSYMQINVNGGEDGNAIAVTLSGSYTADNDEQLGRALRACNDMNAALLQAKLYMDQDNDLIVAAEFFFKSPEDLAFLLETGLQMVVVGKRRFRQRYEELQAEDSILSQLDNDDELSE